MSHYDDAIKLQRELAKKIITKDCVKKIRSICATDVAYKGNTANASAVIVDAKTLEVLEHVTSKTRIRAPYIPGLLMLRESEPILSVLKLLQRNFDLLLIDGNGQLHPRKCGIATYLGIILNKPSVGVSKSLLCGKVKGDSIELDGKVLAKIIEKQKGKRIFVSVGHKTSLKSAVKIVESLIKEGQWLPEPARIADMYSKT